MRSIRRRGRNMLAVALMMSMLLVGAVPGTAHADRCEPTEPVLRVVFPRYEEPVDERDSPFCYVMLNYVYPRVCDNYDTLLNDCIRTINPDPNEPLVIYQFSPDTNRLYCNLYLFSMRTLGQSATCTFE